MKKRAKFNNLYSAKDVRRWAILDPVMRRAFSKLSTIDQQIIKLRYWDELSTEETASRLGMSQSATRASHFRMIKRFNKILRQELRSAIKELQSAKLPRDRNIQESLQVISETLKKIS